MGNTLVMCFDFESFFSLPGLGDLLAALFSCDASSAILYAASCGLASFKFCDAALAACPCFCSVLRCSLLIVSPKFSKSLSISSSIVISKVSVLNVCASASAVCGVDVDVDASARLFLCDALKAENVLPDEAVNFLISNSRICCSLILCSCFSKSIQLSPSNCDS